MAAMHKHYHVYFKLWVRSMCFTGLLPRRVGSFLFRNRRDILNTKLLTRITTNQPFTKHKHHIQLFLFVFLFHLYPAATRNRRSAIFWTNPPSLRSCRFLSFSGEHSTPRGCELNQDNAIMIMVAVKHAVNKLIGNNA